MLSFRPSTRTKPYPPRAALTVPSADFPARDDERFLAHSLAHRDPDGSCRIEYKPVTITRWPPAERVYGR